MFNLLDASTLLALRWLGLPGLATLDCLRLPFLPASIEDGIEVSWPAAVDPLTLLAFFLFSFFSPGPLKNQKNRTQKLSENKKRDTHFFASIFVLILSIYLSITPSTPKQAAA